MTRAPRRARAAALCLAAGIVVTVAISWCGAAWAPRPGDDWSEYVPLEGATDEPGRLSSVYRAGLGAQTAVGRVLARDQWAVWPRVVVGGDLYLPTYVDVYRAGWPWAALEWTDLAGPFATSLVDPWSPRQGEVSSADDPWEYGIAIGSHDWRRVPIRPAGWGFGLAADVVLWGGLMGGVVTAVRWRRRSWRVRRGLCVGCGYQLRDERGAVVARCPECGVGAFGDGCGS